MGIKINQCFCTLSYQKRDFLQLIVNAEEDVKAIKAGKEEKPQKKVEDDLHALIDEQENDSYFDLKTSKKTTLTKDEIYGQVGLLSLPILCV